MALRKFLSLIHKDLPVKIEGQGVQKGSQKQWAAILVTFIYKMGEQGHQISLLVFPDSRLSGSCVTRAINVQKTLEVAYK